MLENAVLYARIILLALPFNVLQLLFQSFCVTAEKPRLGLTVTVMSGVTNMVMDAVLVMLLPQEYKLAGAAAATALSETVGGLVPLIYFGRENDSILRLGRCSFDEKAILKACTNGSSEFMSNISMSLVGMLYNIQLIRYAGELLAAPLAGIFVGYDAELMEMTVSGFRIFALSFLFMGYAIYGSGFFTALNDGLTSALISFLRTLVFQVAAVLLLPELWGLDGVWISIVAAEFMAVVFSVIFLIAKRKKYHY